MAKRPNGSLLMQQPWYVQFILWALGQWKWFALITLILTLMSWIFLDWSRQRAEVITRLETDYSQVQLEQTQWLSEAERIISEAAGPAREIPAPEELQPLRKELLETASKLREFSAPTADIEKHMLSYTRSLEMAAGSINQYDGEIPRLGSVMSDLQSASNDGGEFAEAIDSYLGSLFWSFMGVVF